jgi:hypothetical protein
MLATMIGDVSSRHTASPLTSDGLPERGQNSTGPAASRMTTSMSLCAIGISSMSALGSRYSLPFTPVGDTTV